MVRQIFTHFSSCIQSTKATRQRQLGTSEQLRISSGEQTCIPIPHPHYLSHLLLSLCLGGLSVSVVVRLNDNQVVALRVNDKFSRCVLQWEGNLVEDCPQFLQCQNPGGQRCKNIQQSSEA